MLMFCALSLAISASCWPRMLPEWSQAKSAPFGVVEALGSAASRTANCSMAAGWADADMAADSRRIMEVSCIVKDYGGRELPGVMFRDLCYRALRMTHRVLLV